MSMTAPLPPARHAHRMWLLAGILLAARLIVLQHPVPVHGDDERLAYGVAWLADRWFDKPTLPDDLQVPLVYAVHRPGYPLWVILGAGLHALGLRTYAALTLLSLVASVIEPLLFYRFAARGLRPATAWWAALALGLSPIHWFYSVTAMNYAAGSCIGMLIVMLAWPLDGSRRRPVLAALICAAGMGIRPDIAVWFAPVLLGSTLRHRDYLFSAIVVMALATAAFAWMAASQAFYSAAPGAPTWWHTRDKLLATSVFRLGLIDGLARNSVKLAANLAWSLGIGLLVLAMHLPSIRRARREERGVLALIALWLAPALAFNAFIHMTEPGHAIWHIAPLILLLAMLVERRSGPRAWQALAVIVIASALQFTAYPWSERSHGWKRVLDAKIAYVSRVGIKNIDRRGAIHTPGDLWRTKAHDAPD